MLKKLVRYGNSNALVLDKAILELLNIEEGSVVKISTDGRSIILTPQKRVETQKVNETVTSAEAMHKANIENSMKFYTNLDSETRKVLEQEMGALIENHQALIMSAVSNKTYQAEAKALKENCGTDQIKFTELNKALLEKYAPDLALKSQKMIDFDKKCRKLAGMEVPSDMEEKQQLMEKAMKDVFVKNQSTQQLLMVAMNTPEYQHAAQLLTEQFQDNQNSAEFSQAMMKMMYEFCPEMENLHQELEAVSKKYSSPA